MEWALLGRHGLPAHAGQATFHALRHQCPDLPPMTVTALLGTRQTAAAPAAHGTTARTVGGTCSSRQQHLLCQLPLAQCFAVRAAQQRPCLSAELDIAGGPEQQRCTCARSLT